MTATDAQSESSADAVSSMQNMLHELDRRGFVWGFGAHLHELARCCKPSEIYGALSRRDGLVAICEAKCVAEDEFSKIQKRIARVRGPEQVSVVRHLLAEAVDTLLGADGVCDDIVDAIMSHGLHDAIVCIAHQDALMRACSSCGTGTLIRGSHDDKQDIGNVATAEGPVAPPPGLTLDELGSSLNKENDAPSSAVVGFNLSDESAAPLDVNPPAVSLQQDASCTADNLSTCTGCDAPPCDHVHDDVTLSTRLVLGGSTRLNIT